MALIEIISLDNQLLNRSVLAPMLNANFGILKSAADSAGSTLDNIENDKLDKDGNNATEQLLNILRDKNITVLQSGQTMQAGNVYRAEIQSYFNFILPAHSEDMPREIIVFVKVLQNDPVVNLGTYAFFDNMELEEIKTGNYLLFYEWSDTLNKWVYGIAKGI